MTLMLVNGLDKVCTFVAPRCHTENLVLQVWASLYRLLGRVEISIFRSYNSLQSDILQAVRFGVSLGLHFTPKRPAYKMPLNEALCEETENTLRMSIKEQKMAREELHRDLHDTYMKYYVEGFKKDSVELIDKIVRYPIAYINAGTVEMCYEYPINPSELKREKQWDHSIDWKFEITAVNEHSAHAVASAIRCRKDGTKIENVHGFYAFTMTDEGWKMFAVADVTF